MLLVTGITGHSGQYFLEELIQNHYTSPIRCVIRETSDTKKLDNSGLNIERFIGDLNDKSTILKAMEDVDQIVHIYNIHHSISIVKAAIEKRIKRVILIHTTGIYSQFKNASKDYIRIEEEIRRLAESPDCLTSITILRPTMIYGDLCDKNISKFIKWIDKYKIIPVINGGNNLIQPVNARDLGKAYYSVLMNKDTANNMYDLSGERPVSIIETFKMISHALNKKTIFLSLPLNLCIFLSTIIKFASLKRIDITEKIQRMGENRSYSHQKAKEDFNYSPMSFNEGIAIEVKQYIKRKN